MVKTDTVHTLTDEELVFKIVDTNSPQLFAVLYDRFAKIVYNKCYSFSKNKEEAEDLTHDVFVRLFIKLKTFKGNSKFSTWLYSFTYNFCINYVQRNHHKKNEKITVVTDDIKEDDIVREVDDAELLQLKSEKLAKALALLDAKDKTILLMKYQDNMSILEIKELLKIGESAVKMRLKRAKQRVVSLYEEIDL